MGCCCSTNRWDSPATMPCRSASGYCAPKKDGKALYEYARAGEEVDREARDVTIWSLELTADPSAPETLRMVAKVSKGTYIRTLAEDIGEALGCGAHLTALRRVATGHF